MQNTERHGNYDKTFALLEAIKGTEITCIYCEVGFEDYQGIRGKIEIVEPYESITINGRIYSFIGERIAITHLSVVLNNRRECIYFNENVPRKYTGYVKDPVGLIHAQTNQLGYSVKSEEMNQNQAQALTLK